jgi:GNAT superfamily N-acetyltransferase
MELQSKAPGSLAPQVAATIGEVPRDAVAMLAEAMGPGGPRAVKERCAAGRRCFAAWIDGAIASYGWVSTGEERIGELERPFRMRDGEAYVWDCVTLPPFRRQGLYTALLRTVASLLREEGVDRLWIGAGLYNAPSIQGFATAGFRTVINLTYIRLLFLQHIWVTDDAAAPANLIRDARRSLLGPSARPGRLAVGQDAQRAQSEVRTREKGL